jgi:UDP-glucose 4-epimerase
VYGPRQDPHGEAGVVAIFFGRIANGQELHIFGNGRQTRDYVFVADVVAATLAGASGSEGVYNVGTGTETSVLELAEACKRASSVDAEVVFDPPRLGELSRSVLDPSKAEAALGWSPSTSLDAGLEATWNFVRAAEGEGEAGAN